MMSTTGQFSATFSSSLTLPLLILGSTLALSGVVKLLRIGSREAGLPPGPPTRPIIGNLGIFPKELVHYKFTEWARIYGPILSLKIGPETVIVLTGITEVKELMDQNSAATSDRPRNYMLETILEGMYFALAPYGETWKLLRRASHVILSPKSTDAHIPIQRAEAIQLLYDIIQSPERFFGHTLRYSESVILSVLFGTRCPSDKTEEVIAFRKYNDLLNLVVAPGAHPPLDLLPFLRYVPERWARWKTLCRETKKAGRDLSFGLLAKTEERVRQGNANGCFMEEVLARQKEFGLSRDMVAGLGQVLIDGGSETTSSILQGLIQFLTAFPHVQKRAQEEIDSVIGSSRLPTLEDFDSLPYVQALLKEAHRFRPVLPLVVPHAALDDINYKGYRIPKGATIFINVWGILHDPEIFEDPESFNPDRYLLSELGTKPGVDIDGLRSTLHFGSGRRICPGIHLANNSLMFNTMNLLWAFDIAPGSRPVDIWDCGKGLSIVPNPFECNITVRGEGRKEIIEREFVNSIETFKMFEGELSDVDKRWLKNTRECALKSQE